MTPVRFSAAKASDRERRVFRRRQRPLPPPWRQGMEGILMALLGAGLLAILVWLPQRFDALVVVSETIADLIRGLAQLLEALLGLATVLLIAALLFAGLICLLGGVTRLTRACSRALQASSRPRRRRPAPAQRRHPSSQGRAMSAKRR